MAEGERVVTRAALEGRGLQVARVPDAFGSRGGCFIRGYTDCELELMLHAATRGGQTDLKRLNRVQLAQCLLTTADAAGPRLLGEGAQPTRDEVDQVDQFPPAALERLVQISDSLAGLTPEVKGGLLRGETWLEQAESGDAMRLVSLDDLLGGGLAVERSDLFGELGAVWVREYQAQELAAWELLGVRGRQSSSRRLRWAKLAACLLVGPSADSPRLIGPSTGSGQGSGSDVSGADMKWIGTHIRPGDAIVLERMADALSGWSADTEARLATAELPLPGALSGSGASTD